MSGFSRALQVSRQRLETKACIFPDRDQDQVSPQMVSRLVSEAIPSRETSLWLKPFPVLQKILVCLPRKLHMRTSQSSKPVDEEYKTLINPTYPNAGLDYFPNRRIQTMKANDILLPNHIVSDRALIQLILR